QFKAALSRTPEATAPAFKRHVDDHLSCYGRLHIVNLLDEKRQELEIASAYADQLTRYKDIRKGEIDYTHFVRGEGRRLGLGLGLRLWLWLRLGLGLGLGFRLGLGLGFRVRA